MTTDPAPENWELSPRGRALGDELAWTTDRLKFLMEGGMAKADAINQVMKESRGKPWLNKDHP